MSLATFPAEGVVATSSVGLVLVAVILFALGLGDLGRGARAYWHQHSHRHPSTFVLAAVELGAAAGVYAMLF